MPANIVLTDLTEQTFHGAISPLIATRSDMRDGTRDGAFGALFIENWDSQPDWNSGLPENDLEWPPEGEPDREQRVSQGHILPNNWTSSRQNPSFSPVQGYPDNHHAITIGASEHARSGTKCWLGIRESLDPSSYWSSECALFKYFPTGYDELYVEFYIKFLPGWTDAPGVNTKIFRIGSWSGSGSEYQAFSGGELGPVIVWNWTQSTYGLRNQVGFRGGPHGDNYNITSSDIPGLPRALVGAGDLSLNWTTNQQGQGVGGSDPQIPDLVNGGYLLDDPTQIVSHAQVFGNDYNKLAFYVKMNTSPGANDGIFIQWFNDIQLLYNNQAAWCFDSLAKWNYVEIGGNTYFKEYPTSDARQERYAIDDIMVRSEIPEGLSYG